MDPFSGSYCGTFTTFALHVPEITFFFCSAANVPPTFVLIYSRFGPSYPGDYNNTKSVYYLHYPVCCFYEVFLCSQLFRISPLLSLSPLNTNPFTLMAQVRNVLHK